MKYASEIIGLLAPFPGRPFRMAEILRHVGKGRPPVGAGAEAMRKAVRRVLAELESNGQLTRSSATAKSATYAWNHPVQLRVPDSLESGTQGGTISRPQLRL